MSVTDEKHLQNLLEFSKRLSAEIIDLIEGKTVHGGCSGKDNEEKIKNTLELKKIIDAEASALEKLS